MLIKSSWNRSVNAGLYRLENPFACLRHEEHPSITKIDHQKQWEGGSQPLLFVHGMSFNSPRMVVDDYINPLEKAINLYRTSNDDKKYPLYFVFWDSGELNDGVENLSHRYGILGVLLKNMIKGISLPWLGDFLNQMESRLKISAQNLEPFFRELYSQKQNQKPWVLSHSYGSMFWSEIVNSIVQYQGLPQSVGIWWSMQAALGYKSFSKGECYFDVSKAYDPKNGGKMHEWYSRYDIVLRTLYRLGKKQTAAGQVGLLAENLRCSRDVSEISGESHGLTSLSKRGNFFHRVAEPLAHDAFTLLAK